MMNIKKIIEEIEHKNSKKINLNKKNKPEDPFYFNDIKVNDVKLNISFSSVMVIL